MIIRTYLIWYFDEIKLVNVSVEIEYLDLSVSLSQWSSFLWRSFFMATLCFRISEFELLFPMPFVERVCWYWLDASKTKWSWLQNPNSLYDNIKVFLGLYKVICSYLEKDWYYFFQFCWYQLQMEALFWKYSLHLNTDVLQQLRDLICFDG